MVAPHNRLSGKDVLFVWSPGCQQGADTLKRVFTTSPVLRHFDYGRGIIVTDASDYVSVGVLSQHVDDVVLHIRVLLKEAFSRGM